MQRPYLFILVRKYFRLLTVWMQRVLVYRARIAIYFFLDSINLVVFPFIWLAIYKNTTEIAGFDRADIVTYYIALGLVSTLATAHGGKQLKKEILRGDINQNLVRPLHHIWFRILHDVVYHVILVAAAVLTLILLKIAAPEYVKLPSHTTTYFIFILSLFGSYWISNCLQLLTGITAFWFGETGGFEQIRYISETVLSGQIAPLTFFPKTLQIVATILPFQFLAFFPAQIFLEKIPQEQILSLFISETIWCVFLAALLIIAWNKGLKKYEGVGI